jgi:hypothetical protein
VYSLGSSQDEEEPYASTGPRWYVSITAAALKHFGVAPAPPEDLYDFVCNHPEDIAGDLRARGLGWTLAPAGSDPQALHADIWGLNQHDRSDRCRWPHILWKRRRSDLCTTQIVLGAFTNGKVRTCHYDLVEQVRAPAIVVDSECLHRASPIPPLPVGALPTTGWVSTLSVELCTASGWAAWDACETGGTVKDPKSAKDCRMLSINRPDQNAAQATTVVFDGNATPLVLDPPPWQTVIGKRKLVEEQQEWELSKM